MGHLIRKNSLAVNEILNRVNSEKTYFVYTDKSLRILKIAIFLLLTFMMVNWFYQAEAEPLQVRRVNEVGGQQLFGTPVKNVDLIDLTAVRPYMKRRNEAEIKIKGLVSSVSDKGHLEMILEDGTFLKVKHPMKIEEVKHLVTKQVVMDGKLFKTDDKGTLIYEANSLTAL